VPGIVGLHQANEAIKLLAGIGTPLAGRLMLLDLLENELQVIGVRRRADCPACAARDGASSSNHTSSKAHVNNPISFSTPVEQLSPQELAARLESDCKPTVLDVREQWEYDIAHLPSSRLVPLSELQMTVATLDKDGDYVVICHSGMRSDMAAQWMQAQGFSRVANLAGGIEAWSLTVDPTTPRY
jgi:adenylyltransferase/sulfurtransferase